MNPNKELSPTEGMSIEERILHVGGRNNQAGYVEFGSTQAVQALVSQILRDLPADQLPSSGQVYGIIDPEYGRIFTIARLLAWNYGYSTSAQGSFTRDLDLLMVPWTETARPDVNVIINMLAEACDLRVLGEPSEKPHGRKTWTLVFKKFGDPRFVDLSIFPAPT